MPRIYHIQHFPRLNAWKFNIPSQVIMSCPLHNQPHMIVSSKIHTLLHIPCTRRIHNIHWISLPTTWQRGDRETGIVVPVVLDGADRIVCMPLRGQPSRFDAQASERVETRLCGVTDCSWWRRLNETSVKRGVEL